jgi:hypothetical protein
MTALRGSAWDEKEAMHPEWELRKPGAVVILDGGTCHVPAANSPEKSLKAAIKRPIVSMAASHQHGCKGSKWRGAPPQNNNQEC